MTFRIAVPKTPTSDEENDALLKITHGLMVKEKLTPEESSLLSMLAVLISDYERKRYPHEKVPSAEMLAFLMDQHSLTQADFLPIPQSRISEILAGKRKIFKAQALAFGERFHVNPRHFLEA